SRALPTRVTDPFAVTWHADVEKVTTRTVENAARDGIRVTYTPSGAGQAGCAMPTRAQGTISFIIRRKPQRITVSVRLQYDVVINSHLDAPAQYSTLLHELAHIYCGHLGTPNEKWWPARIRLPHAQDEFEAESTAYLVASRHDSTVQFPPYLDQHLTANGQRPPMSFDRVLKVSKELEDMGTKPLPMRKP
ncbi:MAG: ImmA/IrrE family metallo-endopeptidase, partial [Nocardioidaceae bacterium]|nr:ImmA/IrrE family metallo-endopeptidase [Nocardioidaceae bacterium]